MSRAYKGTTRGQVSRIDFKAVGATVGVFFGTVGILGFATWALVVAGLAGPKPETVEATISHSYEIQGIVWNGERLANGVGVFDLGTYTFEITVDGAIHTCLANLEQAQSKHPIICNDKFVVQPKP
jgi:hypothetical protein